MLLLIGDGAEKSQAKSRNNQVESLGGNQTIFNEEKQTMTRQYYVGKKLLGHCTIRVFAISKNSQLGLKAVASLQPQPEGAGKLGHRP